jgi:hypothetical protein
MKQTQSVAKASAMISICLAALFLVDCGPSPVDRTPENDLTSTPQSHRLTATNLNETSEVRLVCGCQFPLTVTGYGDTSVIRYRVDTKDTLKNYVVTVSANSAGLASGTYTSYISLSAPDFFKGVFHDTIYDTLVVP